jgi:sialic acid synthase SpsE
MRIGPFDTAEQVIVVAEIGNNHEGDPEVAAELVRAAAGAGAHAVKFQTIVPERLVRPADAARIEQLRRFQLPLAELERLAGLAREQGLAFMTTPFDPDTVADVEPLVDALKVASGDNDFVPLLERVAETGKPVVISAGLAGVEVMRAARDLVQGRWRGAGVDQELAILHCVSAYPLPPEQANLAAIPFLAAELGTTIGWSDHTIGIEASVAAVALGARIVEKHLTLRHDFSDFRDHQLSAEPADLAELVRRIESVSAMVGEPGKPVQPAEADAAPAIRRSIAAAGDLAEGHVIRRDDLAWLRPRDGGLPPGSEDELIGRRLTRAVARGESLLPADAE